MELREGLRRQSFTVVMQDVTRHVIENAEGFRDVRIAGRAHRFKAHATETLGSLCCWETVLQNQTECAAETLNEARERGALLTHLDEEFARSPIGEQTNRQVALMPVDCEFVRDGTASTWK